MSRIFLFIWRRTLSWIILAAILTGLSLLLQTSRQGSAALQLAGQRASEAEIELLRRETGENQSFLQQYLTTLRNNLTFQFGKSIRHEEILPLLLRAGKITLIISSLTALLSLIYGSLLALLAALYPTLRTLLEKIHYAVMAIPVFVLAISFIWIFSLWLNLFPPGGASASGWFLLPAVAMSLKSGTRLALFISEFFEREEKKHYARTLKAFGISRLRLYIVHLMKNIALPSLSYWLVDFSSYLAGAAIVETIFALPGLGSLLINALLQYDSNLISATLVFSAFFVFLTSIVSEALQVWFAKFSTEGSEL